MFVFSVYSIVFWWFSSKGWDASWHFQMQHSQPKFSDIHVLHGIAATTSTTTTITSHPPLSPTTVTTTTTDESFTFTSSTFSFWGKSRRKASFSHLPHSVFEGSLKHESFIFTSSTQFLRSRRKASFSRLPLSVPTTHSGTSEPCHVLRLLAARLGRATCARKKISDQWASVWPIGIMWLFGSCVVMVSESFGTPGWIKKICKIMILGKAAFENSYCCLEQSLRLPRKTKSTNSKKNRGKSGI